MQNVTKVWHKVESNSCWSTYNCTVLTAVVIDTIVSEWHFKGTGNGLHQAMQSRTCHDMFFRYLSSFHWQAYRQKKHTPCPKTRPLLKKKTCQFFSFTQRPKDIVENFHTCFRILTTTFSWKQIGRTLTNCNARSAITFTMYLRLTNTSRNNCTMFFLWKYASFIYHLIRSVIYCRLKIMVLNFSRRHLYQAIFYHLYPTW